MELDFEAKARFQERFKIISLLGKGSFGHVYECQDRRDSQIYAVKVISKINVKKSKIECLREEAKILSTIDHPNIVKVYEFVETDAFIFLKMEIVKNGTLEKLIQKRFQVGQKFTDDEIATIMGSLLKGVNHIHAVSIIHRDIKPENILLPNENKLDGIKIADFGLSTKLDFHYPKTATSKCGTMLFMAPEILNNYTYTKSVDIWACSIIMHMLCSGKHPFFEPKMSTDQYKKKIKTVKFPQIPNRLAQDFITRISKVEPNERYSTQQALRHPWLTRNFEDQIPLSLHQSFAGFEKSNQISHIIKTIITLRLICSPTADLKIPESYLTKVIPIVTQKQNIVKEGYLIHKGKSKNKISTREINSVSDIASALEKEKEKQEAKNEQVQNQNPTIKKLNTIFNSLFGKRSKLQLKTYTEEIVCLPPRENRSEMPDISAYKARLENEIERAINESKTKSKAVHKRILPINQAALGTYVGSKEALKSEMKCSSNYKMRSRKKSSNIKLYD